MVDSLEDISEERGCYR